MSKSLINYHFLYPYWYTYNIMNTKYLSTLDFMTLTFLKIHLFDFLFNFSLAILKVLLYGYLQ